MCADEQHRAFISRTNVTKVEQPDTSSICVASWIHCRTSVLAIAGQLSAQFASKITKMQTRESSVYLAITSFIQSVQLDGFVKEPDVARCVSGPRD
mmetsp:Transcript_36247/g.57706  ORF Transcript_36247/g.57706 Transcript_36247/m.57706 type:complete len:96 (+) Transcript_36247:117-404(+)